MYLSDTLQVIYLPWSKHVYFCRNTPLPLISKEELGFIPLTQMCVCVNSCVLLIISEGENSLHKLESDSNLLSAVCYEWRWTELSRRTFLRGLCSALKSQWKELQVSQTLFLPFLVWSVLFFSVCGYISVAWHPWLFGIFHILNSFYIVTHLELYKT